jgi:hypothetical protein
MLNKEFISYEGVTVFTKREDSRRGGRGGSSRAWVDLGLSQLAGWVRGVY